MPGHIAEILETEQNFKKSEMDYSETFEVNTQDILPLATFGEKKTT